jgi:hypothetical protein
VKDGGSKEDRPSLMRSLGLFFGHVADGIRAKPGADSETEASATTERDARRIEVDRRVEEEQRDGMIIRRTTIEEVELPASRPPPDS